jgi:predicted DNA-binding protein YlxM (UPF0122 family)
MPQIGESHHNVKLTAKQVIWARKLHYNKGVCMSCCAKLLDNVSRQTLYDAITGRTWSHIDEGFPDAK